MDPKDQIHVLSRAVIIDKGYILLCKTLDLPKPFYFLPGGHIEHGERATETVLRELSEEADAKDCHVKRLLGCLEYSFELGSNSICHNHEYNFIFQIISSTLTKESPIPCLEDHIELLWMPLSALSRIDFRPKPLQLLIPKWIETPSNISLASFMI